MKITNVRLGFATNSSSSHSIIFSPEYNCHDDGDVSDCEFGWEDFVLDTKSEKLAYLAVAVSQMLSDQHIPDNLNRVILQELFRGTKISDNIDKIMKGYIDHQSRFSIQHNSWEDLTSRVRSCIDVFSDPRIIIYGGNDNDIDRIDYDIPPAREICISGSNRVKKDGDAIILYNVYSGAKIRISEKPYEKSTTPELVDLKVTDYCPFGCGFCYQGSSQEGKDAGMYKIGTILKALAELGVFEVAIGGGEPTASDKLAWIVRTAYDLGITPNITTYSTEWLNDSLKKDAVKECCSGIGVSVHSLRDFEKVEVIKRAFPNKRVVMQHVFGVQSPSELARIFYKARTGRIPVLLLGYKTTGRGGNCVPNMPEQLRVYKDELPELSVDTAFANQHSEILAQFALASGGKMTQDLLVSPREGAFSMYIDAVNGLIGPSSYCDSSQMIKLPDTTASEVAGFIKEQFAKF